MNEPKQQFVDNQSNPSFVSTVSDEMPKVAETSTSSPEQEKEVVNTNGGVLQNEMKQELLDFTVSSNVLSNRHKDFMGLCERLNTLGKKHSIYRLKGLFYIDPEENENETDLDLDLDSMEDYVTFLENTEIKFEPRLGMGNDGKISTDWVNDNNPIISIDFLGNRNTYCIFENNDRFHKYKLEVNELINKLTELQVI